MSRFITTFFLFIFGFLLTAPFASAFSVSPPVIRTKAAATTALQMGFLEDAQGFLKRFTMKAQASHILIKGGAEAENKLEDLKIDIDNSPVKFAAAAAQYSECPSSRGGGSLGEFGPGSMVKEFDAVVFNDDVGVVHGPIQTQVSVLLLRCVAFCFSCVEQTAYTFYVSNLLTAWMRCVQFGYHLIYINSRTD